MSVPVRLLLWNQVVESQGHIPLTQLAASYQLILEPKVPFGAELGIGDLVLPGLAASEPDNMNQRLVRVDLGTDPKTGQRLYALHPQRKQKASMRQLLPVFRRSAIAGRLREQTRVEPIVRAGKTIRKGRAGVKVGWRQFREGKCPCIKTAKPAGTKPPPQQPKLLTTY